MNKWQKPNSGDEDETQPMRGVLLSREDIEKAQEGWRQEARQMLEQLRAEDDMQEIIVVTKDAATG